MIFKLKTHKEFSALQADRDNLLTKLTELESKVDTTKDYAALEADRNTIFNEREELREQANTHNLQLVELRDSQAKAMEELVSSHTKAMVDLKADYDKQISDLKAEVKKETVSAEEKVISTLAQIGVPQDQLPSATETVVTPEGCYNKWQSLLASNSKEANQFYNTNREAIKQFVGFRG